MIETHSRLHVPDVKQGSDLMMSQIGETPVTAAPTRAHLSNASQSAAHKTPAAYGGPHGLHYRTEQGGAQTNASEKKRQTSQPQQRHGATKDDNRHSNEMAAMLPNYRGEAVILQTSVSDNGGFRQLDPRRKGFEWTRRCSDANGATENVTDVQRGWRACRQMFMGERSSPRSL